MQTDVEKKYPVAIFELIPKNRVGSGFVREDTLNTPDPIRILYPKNRSVMNKSIVQVKTKDESGDEIWVDTPIRYIYGQSEILKEKQEQSKMETSLRDKIVFINGYLTVPKTGSFVGLYKFMMSHAQNETNPDRIERLRAIFREIKPAKQAAEGNKLDFQIAQAMGIIMKLVKEKKEGYEYDEAGINVLCAPFNVHADSPSEQVAALVAIAKARPLVFLEEAKKGVQTVSIEIKHAIQMRVIKIDGAAITYSDGTVIKKFSNAQNTDEKKLEALGSYFQKVDGKEAYEIFKIKLDAAKAEAVNS